MSESEQIQQIEQPTSITVFGVLNIIFGIIGLLYGPYILYRHFVMVSRTTEVSFEIKIWILFALCLSVGLSICSLILGIGLLKLKKWARRGSVVFALVYISLIFCVMALKLWLISPSVIPDDKVVEFIAHTTGRYINCFIYPVTLLIFMKTKKFKQAFGR